MMMKGSSVSLIEPFDSIARLQETKDKVHVELQYEFAASKIQVVGNATGVKQLKWLSDGAGSLA